METSQVKGRDFQVSGVESPGYELRGYGGVSASSDSRAAAVGAHMLVAGGNAVDAAIATAFALAVHEPAMSHLGGQGNMLVHLPETGETIALDFYACAPGAASPDMYEWIASPTQGGYRFWTKEDRNTVGAASVCIPGNVAGWVTAHEKWGRLSLAEVVAPAVSAAELGSRASKRTASFIAEQRDKLAQFEASAGIFLNPDGSPKAEGDLIVQPDLAATLRRIGQEGLKVFYEGDIGRAIVDAVQRAGGVLTLDDLKCYPSELMIEKQPDWATFRGLRVAGASPQASALLLNILAVLDGPELDRTKGDPGAQHHFMVEAMKLAFAERAQHIGDHDFVNVPLEGLINPEYAAARRALIDAEEARFPGPGDPWAYQGAAPDPEKITGTPLDAPAPIVGTTHHSHVDQWGGFVALTQSLGDAFGSCMVVPGTGVILNNAMKLFDPRPGVRIAGIQPYKRPMTPWPTLIFEGEQPILSLGSPSGTRIPNAISQVLVNLFVHGMSLQEAVDRPRLHWSGDELEVEENIGDEVKEGLVSRGHQIEYRSARSPWFGAVQIVSRDPETGLCSGAADPRRNGAAVAVQFAHRAAVAHPQASAP